MSELFAEEIDVWASVIGQDTAVARLRAASANPVHAYLLVGPAGSGTKTAAFAFAAALLGPAARDQRLALAGEHPDVRLVERVGAAISVEQAEDIIRAASLAPVEGRRKVLILDEFHLLRAESAAKLLKTVEEPSRSTVFVILADDVPPELVTIASRCVRIDFGPLAEAVVRGALERDGASETVASHAARAAAGNLERARLLAADPDAAARWDAFASVPSRLDGHGFTVAGLVDELMGRIEGAATPLAHRHARETAAFDSRLDATGERGSAGARKAMEERHKRELRRHRADELRSGLAAMSGAYRDRLVAKGAHRPADFVAAVATIADAGEAIDRNPNETLLLQALLLSLPSG